MIPDETQRKKALLQRRIVGEVTAYFTQFNAPLPLKVLAAKYGKPSREHGDFAAIMEELVSLGRLRIDYLPSGARQVFPITK